MNGTPAVAVCSFVRFVQQMEQRDPPFSPHLGRVEARRSVNAPNLNSTYSNGHKEPRFS
jgi:hypothetical protein